MSAVILALIGNVILNPEYFRVFLAYFIPTVAVVLIMLGRVGLLKAFLYFVRTMSESVSGMTSRASEFLRHKISQISGLIKQLSEDWNVPVNFMFIGSPGDHFLYG